MDLKSGKLDFVENTLLEKEQNRRLRSLRPLAPSSPSEVRVNGRILVNFSSNDYLGLSKHPLLRERAVQFMERYGTGSTGSRLICGDYEIMERMEEKIATLKKTEAALIFNSGFQANLSLIPALSDTHTLILSDQLNHNSIINGARLARCKVLPFRHNDLDHLEMLLRKNRSNGHSRILVITESIFSVDGDRSDLDSLIHLSRRYDVLLIVDDAHATGVVGENGMGLTCGRDIDVAVGTFSKACGGFGAYVACSKRVRDYFINCCSGFIYSTALPPSVLGAIDAALDLIPGMNSERERLHRNADFLRDGLRKQGWPTGTSSTQIVPIIIGEDSRALALSGFLESHGVLAIALRPPTVEPGKSRIRLSLTAAHTRAQLQNLLELLGQRGSDHAES